MMQVPVVNVKNFLSKRSTLTFILVFVWVLAVVWNEYIQCVARSRTWESTRISPETEVVNIMFIADPQLIGLQDENKWIGPIARWDSDKYIRTTFNLALDHIQPDVIVFLGDLLDEGSHATPDEYDSYVQRFRTIFIIPDSIQTVYVPGDNDIGGEGDDEKELYKIAAFNKYFIPNEIPPKGVINVKFLDFLRLSLMPNDVNVTDDTEIQKDLELLSEQGTGMYRILANHVPIITRKFGYHNYIIHKTGANVIFTGHVHHSVIEICADCRPVDPYKNQTTFKGRHVPIYDNKLYQMDLTSNDDFFEIHVPPCSYRQGVLRMGYGSAQIDSAGQMVYTVLWLPGRYKQLNSYLVLSAISICSVLCYICITKWKNKTKVE